MVSKTMVTDTYAIDSQTVLKKTIIFVIPSENYSLQIKHYVISTSKGRAVRGDARRKLIRYAIELYLSYKFSHLRQFSTHLRRFEMTWWVNVSLLETKWILSLRMTDVYLKNLIYSRSSFQPVWPVKIRWFAASR
jgi:hypothetical protein